MRNYLHNTYNEISINRFNQDNQFGSRASRSAVDQHVVDPPKAVETKSGAPVHVEQKKEAIKEREELEVPPPASNCDVPVPKQTKRERSPPRATNCDVPQPKNGEKHGPPPATNCDVPLPKPKQPTTGHGTSAVRSGIPKQGNTEHKPAKNFRVSFNIKHILSSSPVPLYTSVSI